MDGEGIDQKIEEVGEKGSQGRAKGFMFLDPAARLMLSCLFVCVYESLNTSLACFELLKKLEIFSIQRSCPKSTLCVFTSPVFQLYC